MKLGRTLVRCDDSMLRSIDVCLDLYAIERQIDRCVERTAPVITVYPDEELNFGVDVYCCFVDQKEYSKVVFSFHNMDKYIEGYITKEDAVKMLSEEIEFRIYSEDSGFWIGLQLMLLMM